MSGALVLMLVITAFVVIGFAVLMRFVYRHRFRPVEEQLRMFGQEFDGRPQVLFQPYYWSFGDDDARAVAWRHGYVEQAPPAFTSPKYRTILRFHRRLEPRADRFAERPRGGD